MRGFRFAHPATFETIFDAFGKRRWVGAWQINIKQRITVKSNSYRAFAIAVTEATAAARLLRADLAVTNHDRTVLDCDRHEVAAVAHVVIEIATVIAVCVVTTPTPIR